MLEIDSNSTALIALDLQNELVEPGGKRFAAFATQLAERRTIDNAALAIGAARSQGIEVIYVTVGWRDGYPEQALTPQMAAVRDGGGYEDDRWGCEVSGRIAPQPGEVVIRKRTVSAFNGTELGRYLTLRGIRTLVLMGVATNWAVEATARDATDLGYRVIVLEDCCASFSTEMHSFSVHSILRLLGAVSSSAEFAETLSK